MEPKKIPDEAATGQDGAKMSLRSSQEGPREPRSVTETKQGRQGLEDGKKRFTSSYYKSTVPNEIFDFQKPK